MVRTLLALNACAVTGAQIVGANRHDLHTAGYGIFPTNDGFVAIGVNNDSLFRRFAGAMGRPDLAEDPRYATYRERDLRYAEVDAVIAGWTSSLTADEVIAHISPSGVPCGRVATPGGMLADPAYEELGLFLSVDDGLGGTIKAPNNPLGFRQESYAIPRLAEHTEELLGEIGKDHDEVERLRAEGAFGALVNA